MKRFYRDVATEPGFHVLLDGKPVLSPARQKLTVPTQALAEAIAEEWRAQGDEIIPPSMPLLRLANTAQDGTAPNRAEVIAAILRFGEHDLVCYRGEGELARRQAEAWDPMLAWAADALGARLVTTQGIGHVDQARGALKALEQVISEFDAYALTALHVMASITGSLVLGLALLKEALNPAQAFQLSRLDEIYQAEKWGLDHEAEQRASRLARELDVAARFLALSAA